jgi:hypothetical protein
MELHEYSDEQIKKEYIRRKRMLNSEWYYVPYNDDPDPEWRSEKPEFIIVNRRLWHLTKQISKFPISKNLSLPKGFSETNASHFVYPKWGVNLDEAAKKLEQHSFVRLAELLDPKNCIIKHKFAFVMTNGARVTANWICDTLELKTIVEEWLKKQQDTYDDFDELHFDASILAGQHDCVAHPFNTYERETNIAFLKRDVFDNLPQSPYKKLVRPGNELP